VVNGYDGVGGVHENLVWNSDAGFIAYTLNNKIIIEWTKSKRQVVISDSTTQLSTLAISPCGRFLAAGEGRSNQNGVALIWYYSIEDPEHPHLLKKLNFHERGVQAVAFSNDSRFLVSIGVYLESALGVWDLSQGLVIKTSTIKHASTNQLKIDPFIEDTI